MDHINAMLDVLEMRIILEIIFSVGSPICVGQFSPWVLYFKDVYFNCFYWFRVICVHLVPCVSLVILNILLFSAIRRAERRRQKLLASRVKAEQAGLMKG